MSNKITILDGGFGHELKLRGVSDGDGTFVAGLRANENKDINNVVESIHVDYLAAGCDVITTNSFVAVPQRMLGCGLATDEDTSHKRASQFIKASVDRARAAIAKYNKGTKTENDIQQKECKQLIAGCVPPLSECYFANKVPTTLNSLKSEYTVILTTLLECNVDILLAETLSTQREAVAILQTLSDIIHKKNQSVIITVPLIWISFTIHDDEPTKLRSDESLEEACQSVIQEANKHNIAIDALGINCSTPCAISHAVPILAKLTAGTTIKVGAYGNCFRTTTSEWMNSLGGEDGDTNDKGMNMKRTKVESCDKDYDEDGYLLPDIYAKFATEWRKSGAQIIGGCCGSRPKHMCKVAAVLKNQAG